MIVRAPGSSANLGPGFDVLGLAVARHVEVATGDSPLHESRPADEHHPATVAYRLGGGRGELRFRTDLPMGRGLGYSGAARVAGAAAGILERDGSSEITDEVRAEVVAITAGLEGHADNVAASTHGGVVVAAGEHVARLPMGLEAAVVVWIPTFTTSTDAARRGLPHQVDRADAVFNLGRTALLVTALVAGRPEFLRAATEDRLHQAHRLAAAEPSRLAIAAALDAGAWGAWLSGSGPTVAALVDPERVTDVLAALPAEGTGRRLEIDQTGVVTR